MSAATKDLKTGQLSGMRSCKISKNTKSPHLTRRPPCWGEVDENLLLITGDIAYKAEKQEYEEAERFLQAIWGITGLTKEQTFIVPGNHDVQRFIVSKNFMFSTVHEHFAGLKKDEERQSWVDGARQFSEGEQFLEMIRAKFSAFAHFAKKCSAIPFDNPYFVFELPFENVTLKIVRSNSALMSWRDDEDRKRELWVGPKQLDDVRQKFGKPPELRLALVHHPLEAYHEHDVRWAWPEIQKTCCILMHGHLHTPRVDLIQNPEHLQLIISGGSVHNGGVWRSQHYSYGSLCNLERCGRSIHAYDHIIGTISGVCP